MSQVNPALFNAMNLKTELEAGEGGDTSEAAHYLSKVLKRPLAEKATEIWRTYLRRYKNNNNNNTHTQEARRDTGFIMRVRKQSEC